MSHTLDSTASGERRLELLERTYGPGTRALLTRVPVRPGMRAADIGCGPGLVTTVLHELVGPKGYVIGVDASADFVAIARENASALGASNPEFVEADAYEPRIPPASFDLVFCRFLLVHLQRPLDCLRTMMALLKPGGWLVCEECEISSGFMEPHAPAYKEMLELMVHLGQRFGIDADLGAKLPRLFETIGLLEPSVHAQQPVYLRGEEKRFWDYTFTESAQRAVAAGLVERAVVNRLAKAAAVTCSDVTTLVGLARSFQVWARKPVDSTEGSDL